MKRILGLILAVMMVLSLCACAAPPEDDPAFVATNEQTTPSNYGQNETLATTPTKSEQPAERTGGTLTFGEFVLDTQLANMNPFVTAGTWTGLRNFIYEELFYFNGVNGSLVPALGESYEWSEDGLTLTIQLNKTAKWQDGEDFNSDDVLYTLNVLKDHPIFDSYQLWGDFESVAASGEDAVVIKLKHTFPELLSYMTNIYIVPEHIFSKEDVETFTNNQPIGTGPFIFEKYTVGTDIQMKANLDYWRGAPQIDKLICKIYNSSPNLTIAFMNHDVEFTMGTVAMPNVPEILNIEGAKIQFWPGPSNFTVHLNNENKFLQDKVLRKALNMSIDPEKMLEVGNYGIAYPIKLNWLHEAFGDFVNTEADGDLVYDIKAAQDYLKENGYTFDGKGKLYTPDGELVELTYTSAAGAPAQQEQANVVQQWFGDLGVSVIPKLATWPEIAQMQKNGEFEMLQAGIGFIPSPYAALSMFHSKNTAPTGEIAPGLNYFRYRNAEVDKLLDQAAAERDKEVLKSLVYEIQELLAADYPFVPMYNGGPKAPYHTTTYEGWDTSVPIFHPISLIQVRPIQK